MKPTRTDHRLKLHPVCAAALSCLLAGPSLAQQAPAAPATPAPAEQMTEVVVTGSRIRGVAPVGAAVNSVSRDAIESSGAVNTAQILQETPQVFNLGVSENSRGQSGGAGNITYGSGINLRGIGPFATLTLVNGHRVIGQGTQGATVDPSIIPSLALERIEIVADGASAIYGSDAVAGVVNLIMRREKGAEGMVRFGVGDGYKERQVGALWGAKWKGGQTTLTVEHTYRSAISGRDRDFFKGDLRAEGGGDFRSSQCSPGNIVIAGVNYPIPAGGVTAANRNQLVAGSPNRCDNSKVQDLVPQQERNSFAFTFNQELTKNIALFADGFATRREYRFRPAALASNLTVPASNPFYVRPAGAPAGTSETVAYSFINDLPVNTANGKSQTWELTTGADFTLPAGWKASALVTYGNNDDLAETLGGLNNAAITAALADRNPATALNVFGSGPNNPATLAAISNSIALSPGDTRFINLAAKADGPLFDLPGGKVRAAFGYERQDIRTIGGQTTGPATNPTFGEVKLERTVDSLFGELFVPLVGSGNAMPGVKRLDLVAAARVDRYSDVGNTDNPKLGLSWVPVDGLTLRGSYGTSFRAPGLTQIRGFTNGGRGGLFVQNYSDPTNGGALRVGVALSAANPDLKPETSTTKTLGFDWQPGFAPRTRLSMTWFDIVYDDQIVGYLSDLTVLNREASFAGTGVIQRNPSPDLVAQLLAQYPISGVPPATWTLFVDGRNKNLAKSVSRGIDFQVQSRVSADAWGDFVFGLNGTVFTKYDVAVTKTSPLTSQLNTIFNPIKYRARASTQWTIGNVSSALFVNYTGAYDNNLATPLQRVNSNTTVDVRLAYALEGLGSADLLKDATIALGVTNLFDKAPPFVNIAQSNNGGGGFDPTLANPVGRVVSLTLNKKF
jgi:iron complex outermembrane receptor protein